jgi:DNA-binding NarL/FixJ family response regulator
MRPARNFRKRIQILIIDREAVFRFGLRRLLAAGDNLRDIAEAENLTQAIHMARQLKPDLIFLQAELLTEKIAEQMNKLRKASPGCKLVITAASLTEGESLRYIRLGASGVVLKSLDPALFIKCVGKVMQGEIWLPKREITKMADMLGSSPLHLPRPVDTLTQREKAIISYLVQGWRNREIAEQLSISEQTVKNHLRAVYDKVGVADRLELVLYAIYQRLDLPAVQVSSKSNS